MPGKALVLHAVDDGSDIAQVDGRIILATADDEIAIAFRVRDLCVGSQDKRARLPIELPRARIRSAGADGRGKLIQRHVARGERAGIDLDPDGGFDAIDVYLRDAREDVDALLHLRCWRTCRGHRR